MGRFGVDIQGNHGKRVSRVYLYRSEDSIGARSCGRRLCNTEVIVWHGSGWRSSQSLQYRQYIDFLIQIYRYDRPELAGPRTHPSMRN